MGAKEGNWRDANLGGGGGGGGGGPAMMGAVADSLHLSWQFDLKNCKRLSSTAGSLGILSTSFVNSWRMVKNVEDIRSA